MKQKPYAVISVLIAVGVLMCFSTILLQKPFPLSSLPIFLLAALGFIGNGHFNKPSIKQRPEYLVPELSPVRSTYQVHQFGYGLFVYAVSQDFNLVPT